MLIVVFIIDTKQVTTVVSFQCYSEYLQCTNITRNHDTRHQPRTRNAGLAPSKQIHSLHGFFADTTAHTFAQLRAENRSHVQQLTCWNGQTARTVVVVGAAQAATRAVNIGKRACTRTHHHLGSATIGLQLPV